jgi:hypothetical protein
MPTAEDAFRACARVGIDVQGAFQRFHPAPPPSPNDTASLSHWLDTIRGSTSIVELAALAATNRFTIARWLAGKAKPRLHEFLLFVDVVTGRCCDLVANLVPIESVPALQPAHLARSLARELAHEEPWTEAILRVLESRPCGPGEIAAQLGIDVETERRCLDKLMRANIVRAVGGHYSVIGELSVDTRAVPRLKAHWAAVGQKRLAAPYDGDVFAYNVMSVAPKDLDAIRERLLGAYREIRAIVTGSPGTGSVALVNLQLVQFPIPQQNPIAATSELPLSRAAPTQEDPPRKSPAVPSSPTASRRLGRRRARRAPRAP